MSRKFARELQRHISAERESHNKDRTQATVGQTFADEARIASKILSGTSSQTESLGAPAGAHVEAVDPDSRAQALVGRNWQCIQLRTNLQGRVEKQFDPARLTRWLMFIGNDRGSRIDSVFDARGRKASQDQSSRGQKLPAMVRRCGSRKRAGMRRTSSDFSGSEKNGPGFPKPARQN